MIFDLTTVEFMGQNGQLYYCIEEGVKITLFKVPSSENVIFRNVFYYPPPLEYNEELTSEENMELSDKRDQVIINFKQTYTNQGIQITGFEKDAEFNLKVTGDSSE